MPFKNPEDKKAWSHANKEKQKEYRLRWLQSESGAAYLAKQLQRKELQKQLSAERKKQQKQLSSEQGNARRLKANEKHRRYRRKQRAVAIGLLGGECCVCGMNDPDVLEFDHIEPLLRKTNGMRTKSGTEKQIIEDCDRMNSFQLLCANCHTKKTRINGEFGFVADETI